MPLKTSRRPAAAQVAALLAVWTCLGCAVEPRAEPQLQVRLWKRANPPIELAPGNHVAAGDELYMTVVSRHALYLYVVNEDAGGKRQVLYPCFGLRRSLPLASRRQHRLPRPLLGRETFWPVQVATPHERLLVLASVLPAVALENAVRAASEGPPCAASLSGDASRWLDGLIAVNLGSGEAAARPEVRQGAWNVGRASQEGWMLAFDLAGLDHG